MNGQATGNTMGTGEENKMIVEDQTLRAESTPTKTLIVFAIKTITVAFVGVISLFVVLWFLNNIIDNRIEQLDDRLAQLSGPAFWAKVERELDRAASPKGDLPAAKKAKLLNDVRVIVARWRPYLDVAADELKTPTVTGAK
jgi:hypothetical protein